MDRDGDGNRAGAGEGDEAEGELVAVRAPLSEWRPAEALAREERHSPGIKRSFCLPNLP